MKHGRPIAVAAAALGTLGLCWMITCQQGGTVLTPIQSQCTPGNGTVGARDQYVNNAVATMGQVGAVTALTGAPAPPSPAPTALPPRVKPEDRLVVGWDPAWQDALGRPDVFQQAGAERTVLGERLFVHSIIRGLRSLNYTRFEIARDVQHLHQLIEAELAQGHPFPLIFALAKNVIDRREELFKRWGACRFLVNDFWGNMPPVRADFDIPGLPLRHFLIPYPDNFVNTFLGFIQDPCPSPAELERRGARRRIASSNETLKGLIWGKFPWSLYRRQFPVEDQGRLLGAYPNLRLYHNCNRCRGEMHHGVNALGVISRDEYTLALSSVDFLLGLGSPHDGPSALEALACGASYLNPVFLEGDVHARRMRLVMLERDNATGLPTFGSLSAFERSKELFVRSSQHRYMETFAPPFVYHVHGVGELIDAVGDTKRRGKRTPFVPHEYQEAVYVQRLKGIVETDYCGTTPPPIIGPGP